jgi:multidrug resistance efflux pump
VAAVKVREGQLVEAGDVLVTLETPELTARHDRARARVDSARAGVERAEYGARAEEIDEARAAAESARAKYERMTTGYRAEEKAQARHELAVAVAEFRQAEQDYGRAERMILTSAASRSELDTALAARDRTQNRVGAAEASLALIMSGYRREDVAEAKAELDRHQARYDLLRNGARREDKATASAALAEAEAELAEAETNLREAVVVAPGRCLIEVLSVRPGDLVAAGQPAVRVLRADDLWVKAFVPSTDLGAVALNSEVAVTVDSHPGRRFRGQIIHIASSSEYTPRNVQSADERRHQVFAVKVRVTDASGVFKSGMAADVFVTRQGGK